MRLLVCSPTSPAHHTQQIHPSTGSGKGSHWAITAVPAVSPCWPCLAECGRSGEASRDDCSALGGDAALLLPWWWMANCTGTSPTCSHKPPTTHRPPHCHTQPPHTAPLWPCTSLWPTWLHTCQKSVPCVRPCPGWSSCRWAGRRRGAAAPKRAGARSHRPVGYVGLALAVAPPSAAWRCGRADRGPGYPEEGPSLPCLQRTDKKREE